jgi:carbamoyl-phosphate synthase large subunit
MGNTNTTEISIMVSSVGRRNYLLEWFRDAAKAMDIHATIVAGDGDPYAPGFSSADRSVVLPPISSENYLNTLLDACVQNDVDLLCSVHDYDITTISTGALERLAGSGVVAVVPPQTTLDVVADKVRTTEALLGGGLLAPLTVEATQRDAITANGHYVVKHRYGSASSGVFIVEKGHLPEAILVSSLSAPSKDGVRSGTSEPRFVVVQEKVEGEEYGLDVICDLDGTFQGVLARRKLRMRAGETDRAITVDSSPFENLARKLASTLELRGNTDVDVIVTPENEQYIIDINPRFGGGYPFVHMAGANVPACYIAWATGAEIDPAWLQYEVGVVSSKYQSVQRSGQP